MRESHAAPRLDHVESWVFDLDNTLYPARYNLFDQVDRRIGLFIRDALGIDEDAARRIQKRYFREHGTTLCGLMKLHDVDPHHFLEFVHDIDVTAIPPSVALDAALAALPGRKLIFTNGSVKHALRVMARLGVGERFEAVFDIVAADYLPKPFGAAYDALCAAHGLEPARTAMFEDIARNLVPAHALGMTTVWVRTESPWAQEESDGAHVHHVADNLEEWLTALVERRRSPSPGSR